jgi:hypothetical protein
MPIAPIMHELREHNMTLDYVPIDAKMIPSESEMKDYGVFQEVKFIGYPIGMWDEKHNLPIVRRGMTASDPVVDFNGRREFLIDAAVFPGSSGSPVYIADDNGSMLGNSFIGPRVRFLGILYAVYEYKPDEAVVVVPIPTDFQLRAKGEIPGGIGFVIKAERMNEFKSVLEEIAKKRDEASKQNGGGK